MLYRIFLEIQRQSKNFATSNDGVSFENRFIQLVQNQFQYSRLFNDIASKSLGYKGLTDQLSQSLNNRNIKMVEYEWKTLKSEILQKNSVEMVSNPWPSLKNHFIYQPMGSQNFPDFIFFTEKYVVPVEVKYTKNKILNHEANIDLQKPMWNSNLPKANGIYIYGVSGKDVSFFKGDAILNSQTRIQLNKFFDDLGANDLSGHSLKEKMSEYLKDLENPFGFKPYIRKAFEQSKSFSTAIDEDGNQYIESYFSKNREKREKAVINLLKEMEKNE